MVKAIFSVILLFCFSFSAFSAEVFPARSVHEAINILKEKGKIEKPELEEIANRHQLSAEAKTAIEKIIPYWNYIPTRTAKLENAQALQTANDFGREWHSEEMIHLTALRGVLRTKRDVRVLDVGCAYGYGVNLALSLGARQVVALDLEPRHLAVLVRDLPVEFLDRVQVGLGVFPDEFKFSPESFDIVMMGLVLHFMTPHQAENSFLMANSILAQDGVFAITSQTIFGTEYQRELNSLLKRVFAGREMAREINGAPPESRKFVFQTYCPDVSSKAPHPMDMVTTCLNLEVAGFRSIHTGEMHLGFTKEGVPVNMALDSEKGEKPAFFSIISLKARPVSLPGSFEKTSPRKSVDPKVNSCARPGCREEGTKICSGCKVVRYCSQECQKSDWPRHRSTDHNKNK